MMIFVKELLFCFEFYIAQSLNGFTEILNHRLLGVAHINIRSLCAKKQRKLHWIRSFLSKNPGIHVLGISETWLHRNKHRNAHIPGFRMYRRDRIGKHGGVAVYVKATGGLNPRRRHDLEKSAECIWLEITLPTSEKILVGNYYRPPSKSKYNEHNFMTKLQKSLEKIAHEEKQSLLLGDFNCNMATDSPSSETVNFKTVLSKTGVTQMVQKWTRVTETTSTLIDIIGTNNPQNIVAHDVIDTGLSDHHMVACVYTSLCHLRREIKKLQ